MSETASSQQRMPMEESCVASASGIAMASFSQDVKASKAMKNNRFGCGNFMVKKGFGL